MGGSGITPQSEVKPKTNELQQQDQISSSGSTQISSATSSEFQTDLDAEASFEQLNQWIKIPQLLFSLESSDPTELSKSLKQSELSILNDYLNMWTNTISELLNKLRDTVPAEGMLGEVHYWRDLCRILDGLTAEVKLP